MKNDNEIIERTGWICLHRKSITSTVFQNAKIWYVWSWCLMKANHEDNEFIFNGKDIIIKRGQFITGRTQALKEMPGITAQMYRTAINYLKSTSRITSKVTNRFTIITVCKYEDYQNKNEQANQLTNQLTNQPLTNKQPATNQQLTTNNNENNENNYNNVNKEEGMAQNFFDNISEYFAKEYKQANGVEYVPTDYTKEREATNKLLGITLKQYPDADYETHLEKMQKILKSAIRIDDNWHRVHMSLPWLAKYYSEILNIAQNGNGKKKRTLTPEERLKKLEEYEKEHTHQE